MTSDSRLNELLDVLKAVEQMKLMLRRTIDSDGQCAESNAEHVWHLAMFILVLAPSSRSIVSRF